MQVVLYDALSSAVPNVHTQFFQGKSTRLGPLAKGIRSCGRLHLQFRSLPLWTAANGIVVAALAGSPPIWRTDIAFNGDNRHGDPHG